MKCSPRRIAVTVLLLAQLGTSPFSAEEVAKIDALAIGAEFSVTRPAGDGCNSCEIFYRKTGDTTVRQIGWGFCTLRACPPPFAEERYK